MQNLDLGFAREGVLLVKVEPRDQSQLVNTWITEFLPRIAELPEVESVGGIYIRPLEFGSIGHGTWAVAEGQVVIEHDPGRRALVHRVDAVGGEVIEDGEVEAGIQGRGEQRQ